MFKITYLQSYRKFLYLRFPLDFGNSSRLSLFLLLFYSSFFVISFVEFMVYSLDEDRFRNKRKVFSVCNHRTLFWSQTENGFCFEQVARWWCFCSVKSLSWRVHFFHVVPYCAEELIRKRIKNAELLLRTKNSFDIKRVTNYTAILSITFNTVHATSKPRSFYTHRSCVINEKYIQD